MMGNTFGGGMGPVGGAESIIDINIAQSSQFGGKIRIIICFFRVVAQIFQQKDVALA